MLLVETYVGKDSRGGKGLFAAQDIAKGEKIFEFNPAFTRFITPEEYFATSGEQRVGLDIYSYPVYAPEDKDPMVGILINLDNARYTNHDDNPNTGHPEWDLDINIALRDIKKGEEITCNYFEFDPDDVIHGMGIVTGKAFLLSGVHQGKMLVKRS